MTTYGTIPTESPESPSSSLQFITRAREQIQTGLAKRRPWKETLRLSSLNFRASFGESIRRIRSNASVFRVNYVIILLFILFVTLLWYPISLIVFIIMMAAWLSLYFLRDDPLTVFGYLVDDRIVMVVLLAATVAVLFMTGVSSNVIIGLSVGAAVILFHAVLRDTDYDDDRSVEDDELGFGSAAAPLQAAASSRSRNYKPTPLKNAASSSFTSS